MATTPGRAVAMDVSTDTTRAWARSLNLIFSTVAVHVDVTGIWGLPGDFAERVYPLHRLADDDGVFLVHVVAHVASLTLRTSTAGDTRRHNALTIPDCRLSV
ncbi:hypothetical protein HC928_21475 [bacterium]|nr:hypothetical protein [bacterium]